MSREKGCSPVSFVNIPFQSNIPTELIGLTICSIHFESLSAE
jgi:hypothetical protein